MNSESLGLQQIIGLGLTISRPANMQRRLLLQTIRYLKSATAYQLLSIPILIADDLR